MKRIRFFWTDVDERTLLIGEGKGGERGEGRLSNQRIGLIYPLSLAGQPSLIMSRVFMSRTAEFLLLVLLQTCPKCILAAIVMFFLQATECTV